MSAADRLQLRKQEREALLHRAIELLQQDGRVVAAWLFGSIGRGEDDGLSDLDLWVVVADEYSRFINAGRREYAAELAPPVLLLEAPQNAPEHGAYLLALYAGQAGPHQIDWYWQPLSGARLPLNARILFDRVGIPCSSLEPLKTDPQSSQDRANAAADRAAFFWAMVPIAAKKTARRQIWESIQMITMVRGALADVAKLCDAQSPGALDLPPPVEPAGQLLLLREIAREMESLAPRLIAIGAAVPAGAITQVHTLLDLVEEMIG